MHEVPLLFLAPTDNNSLSLCSFTTNIPLPTSPPLLGSKLMYIPLALTTKAETTTYTFLQDFFLCAIYLMIIDNWILTYSWKLIAI